MKLNKVDMGLKQKFSKCNLRKDTTLGWCYENVVELLLDKKIISCQCGGIHTFLRVRGELQMNSKPLKLTRVEKARIISVRNAMQKAFNATKWGEWEKLYNLFDIKIKTGV